MGDKGSSGCQTWGPLVAEAVSEGRRAVMSLPTGSQINKGECPRSGDMSRIQLAVMPQDSDPLESQSARP